jgi:hypothetical protein
MNSGWCWNDTHLRNGLVYEIDADFYDTYVYEGVRNKPAAKDVPKKSTMEVDVNPLANWLIFFVKDRFKEGDKINEMVYQNAWGTKRNLNEDINVGFVDIYSPQGELLKHTFDLEVIPKAFLVSPAGVVEMPAVNELGKDWTAADLSLFAEIGFRQTKDRLPIRKSVREGTSLITEYALTHL